jgi:hypothetical protein
LLSSVDETVPNLSLHKHLRKSRCSASYVLIGFSYSALHPPSSFLGSMGFKLWASRLLVKCSTTWSTPPAPFALVIFQVEWCTFFWAHFR